MKLEQLIETEVFRLMGKAWDVEAGLAIVKEQNIPLEEFAVDDLASLLGFVRINKEHAQGVDLNKPVLLIMVEGSLVLIDGYHRTYKAKQKNIKTLKGYVLEEDQAESIKVR